MMFEIAHMMKRSPTLINYLQLLFGVTACVACQSPNNDSAFALTGDTLQRYVQTADTLPVLLDTLGAGKVDFLKNDTLHESWLTTADYGFLYIGPEADTIYVNYLGALRVPPPPPPSFADSLYPLTSRPESWRLPVYQRDPLAAGDFKDLSDSRVKITIDTSRTINTTYPVFIKNLDADTISVGFGWQLPLIMEALDSNGAWRPIQERFRYMCGMGIGPVILPPGEIVLTTAPIYTGNFFTMLRLRVAGTSVFSNAINGHIRYRQFESKYTPDGEYKKAYQKENPTE